MFFSLDSHAVIITIKLYWRVGVQDAKYGLVIINYWAFQKNYFRID